MMVILKILGPDSAAALIANGTVAAAAQEERLTRKQHDSGFRPFRQAIPTWLQTKLRLARKICRHLNGDSSLKKNGDQGRI